MESDTTIVGVGIHDDSTAVIRVEKSASSVSRDVRPGLHLIVAHLSGPNVDGRDPYWRFLYDELRDLTHRTLRVVSKWSVGSLEEEVFAEVMARAMNSDLMGRIQVESEAQAVKYFAAVISSLVQEIKRKQGRMDDRIERLREILFEEAERRDRDGGHFARDLVAERLEEAIRGGLTYEVGLLIDRFVYELSYEEMAEMSKDRVSPDTMRQHVSRAIKRVFPSLDFLTHD